MPAAIFGCLLEPRDTPPPKDHPKCIGKLSIAGTLTNLHAYDHSECWHYFTSGMISQSPLDTGNKPSRETRDDHEIKRTKKEYVSLESRESRRDRWYRLQF